MSAEIIVAFGVFQTPDILQGPHDGRIATVRLRRFPLGSKRELSCAGVGLIDSPPKAAVVSDDLAELIIEGGYQRLPLN